MSDDVEKEKTRPNANYKLSNENVRDDEIVFRYNREHRLEKAPQIVRDLYKPQEQHSFNLIRPLVRTRPLAMMFISIIIACVLITVLSLLGIAGTSYTLEGNHLAIKALRFEGAIIIAIDKTVKKTVLNRLSVGTPPYTGVIEIAVQPLIQGGEVPESIYFHKIFFTFEPEEYYRFSVPFDTDELALVLRTDARSLQLTVKAE